MPYDFATSFNEPDANTKRRMNARSSSESPESHEGTEFTTASFLFVYLKLTINVVFIQVGFDFIYFSRR
jgi:hypothetical protein